MASIVRKNVGTSNSINRNARFVNVAKAFNPQTEYLVKPSFKVPKPRAGYALEINNPPPFKKIIPFSKNF